MFVAVQDSSVQLVGLGLTLISHTVQEFTGQVIVLSKDIICHIGPTVIFS